MKIIKHFVFVVVLAQGCTTIDTIKTAENKIQIHVNHDYESVYRIIVQNSQACLTPQQVVGNIYLDNKTATITELAPAGFPYYTIDIVGLGNKSTHLDIYPTFSWQRDFLPGRISNWLDNGSAKCKWGGFPRIGPD